MLPKMVRNKYTRKTFFYLQVSISVTSTMANYREIFQKKQEQSNRVDHVSSGNKDLEHQSVQVKRKKVSDRINTPVDPSELSPSDRKLLLEKRISQLEENEKIISSLQLEMANNVRERSRYSSQSNSNSSRRQSDSDTYVISRGSNHNGNVASFANGPIPEDDIDTSKYDKYRYLSDLGYCGVQNVRKADKSYRMSVRDKAERLLIERRIRSRGRKRASIIRNTEQMLKERKAKDYSGSSSDEDLERLRYQNSAQRQTSIAKNTIQQPYLTIPTNADKRSRSPKSEDEFVEVPLYVGYESDTSSGLYPYSLPPPQTRKSRRSDVPSAVQVCTAPTLLVFAMEKKHKRN